MVPMFYRVMCLFLLTALVPAPLFAFDLKELRGTGIVVLYESPLENAAKNVVQEYPEMKSEVQRKLQWNILFTPTVILIHENRKFLEETHSNLVTAFAVPDRNMIVVDYSKMERTPFDLRATLEHEICHLVLHHYSKAAIPRWLDEGVAQWVSGGISDIITQDGKDILKQALLAGNLLPLKDISSRFPEEPREVLLSYEESKSFVEFITREYGTANLVAILHGLENNESVEQAVHENLATELNFLEQQWIKGLPKKYSWPYYIADHIYGILFFAAALTTLIGYVILKRRMKNYRDEGDDATSP